MAHDVAIIGLGHVARHQMAALAASEDFRLVAVCDTDADKLRRFAQDIETHRSVSALLESSAADVVVVASPNHLHPEHACSVMASRRRPIVEKPLAVGRELCARITAAREELQADCSVALHAAFGLEIDWYRDACRRGVVDPSDVVRFDCQFYDPYFRDGRVEGRALSLSGSWLDSGVNALSVLFRVFAPRDMAVIDSRMTRVADSPCSEVQGTVELGFTNAGRACDGTIDTNWTIGRDRKVTTLTLRGHDERIVLDHSKQAVLRIVPGERQVLYSAPKGGERLTNHYIGVFADLAEQIGSDTDNFSRSLAIHELLYDAAEWTGGPRMG